MSTPLNPVGGGGPRLDLPALSASAPVVAAAEAAQARPVDPVVSAAQAKAMRQDLEHALKEVNHRMQANGRNLAFSMDDKIDRMVIKVTDSKTGEVVRQIPDETALRIAHSIDELKGLIYDASS